ncbi:MAG TPA: STAS domain-containing protein [Chitinophagaceae bacterium]|nr:STAS domain-containing protein [Chitinophagaceae bacterium]
MFVKIDTKEHFRIFSLTVPSVHANMADELRESLLDGLAVPPRDIILDLGDVTQMDTAILAVLEDVGAAAEAGKASFVLTEITPSLAGIFKAPLASRRLNAARTLTEAIDLVMMERLEREWSMPDEDSEG